MRRIYIVDDDADVRDSLQLLLSTQPETEVAVFPSGDEFLDAAHALAPGVVLLDYYMPGRNGLEVLELLRDRTPPFATVMITAHEDVNVAVKALEAGACDFLEKPYEYENLLIVLRIAFAHLEHGVRAD
jgi:two-component system, LuxR family, response regulator FixJ